MHIMYNVARAFHSIVNFISRRPVAQFSQIIQFCRVNRQRYWTVDLETLNVSSCLSYFMILHQ